MHLRSEDVVPGDQATVSGVADEPDASAGTASVLAVAAAVRSGQISARAVIDAALDRIAAADGAIGAFCALDPVAARAAADALDARRAAGEAVGPLAGVPFGVKDLEAAAGHVTTFGDPVHRSDPPARRSSVEVARLEAAGAIVVGKTNTPAYGFHAETDNLVFGPTRNPRAPSRTSGGSSGGSAAALAAGLVPLCTGSDGGGSIRIPSAVCGISGFKVTHGVVPNGDDAPPTWGLYSTRGPMARTFAEIAVALDVVRGFCARDLTSFELAGSFAEAAARASLAPPGGVVRVAVSTTLGYATPDPRVVAATERAVRQLEAHGARIVDADAAVFEEPPVRAWITRAAAGSWRTATQDPTPWSGRFLDAAQLTAQWGEHVTAAQILDGEEGAHRANLRLASLWEHADVLVTPATPALAPRVGAPSSYGPAWASDFTLPFNLVRAPAAVVPCGTVADDGDDLPVAIQIVAPRTHDLRLMSIATAAESILTSR